jgi:hypothetical protein
MPINYGDIDLQLDVEFHCDHSETELRRRRYKTFQRIFLQCMTCGSTIQPVPKSELDEEGIDDIPHLDEDLPRLHKQRRQARRKELIEHHKAEEKAAWSRKYTLYMQSLEWKERRQRVLRREQVYQNREVPLCTECWQKPGEVCHHLSYRHVFAERTHELALICHACHDKYHGIPPWEPLQAPGPVTAQ